MVVLVLMRKAGRGRYFLLSAPLPVAVTSCIVVFYSLEKDCLLRGWFRVRLKSWIGNIIGMRRTSRRRHELKIQRCSAGNIILGRLTTGVDEDNNLRLLFFFMYRERKIRATCIVERNYSHGNGGNNVKERSYCYERAVKHLGV